MKIVKTILTVFLFIGATSVFAQTRWNMHVAWPESNFHTQGVMEFANLVSERSNGQLEIVVNSGGSLGFEGQEILRVVRNGTLPIAEVLMGNVQGTEPIFGLTSLPLLVEDYEGSRALYKAAKPAYEAALERNNQMLLYAVPWPPSGMFTKNEVTTPGGFGDLKVRTYDSNSAEFVEGLDAQGVAIPFSELFTALSTGLVNSVLTSTPTGVDASLWEVTDYFERINYAFPLNMVTVNADMFSNLPQEAQDALLEAAQEVEQMQWEASRQADQDSQSTLTENGITVVNEVSSELNSAMQEVADSLKESWLSDAGQEGQQVLNTFDSSGSSTGGNSN